MAVDASTRPGYPRSMTAAVRAMLEQAKQLTEKERTELVDALIADAGPWPQPITREELDRRIAEGIAQIERGETISEEQLFAELEAM